MGQSVPEGVLLVMIAGLMSGTGMLPSKFARVWKWENIWLVFSLVSLIVIPWILAVVLVNRLLETYTALSLQQLALPMVLGAGWGIAQILFGVSVRRLGLGIAYAIIVGLGAQHGAHVRRRELLQWDVSERGDQVNAGELLIRPVGRRSDGQIGAAASFWVHHA